MTARKSRQPTLHGFAADGDRLLTPKELHAAIPWLGLQKQANERHAGRLDYCGEFSESDDGKLRTRTGSVRYHEGRHIYPYLARFQDRVSLDEIEERVRARLARGQERRAMAPRDPGPENTASQPQADAADTIPAAVV